MTRVLITGANGCLGRALAAAAGENGHHVVGLVRQPVAGPWHQTVVADLGDEVALRAAVAEARPDVLFHAAGRLRGSAAELLAANARPVPALCEALHAVQARARLLLLGSAAEYGSGRTDGEATTEPWPPAPATPYGVSKFAATQLAFAHGARLGLDVRVARLANVLGPGASTSLAVGSFVAQLAGCRARGEPFVLRVGELQVARDHLDVEDACRGLLSFATYRGPQRLLHLASGQCVTLGEVVDRLREILAAPLTTVIEADRAALPGPAIVRLSTAAAARELQFRARVPLVESLRRMWHAAVASTAVVAPR